MISLTNSSFKRITFFFITLLITLSGCTTIHDSTTGMRIDTPSNAAGYPIAVMPLVNLGGRVAPLKEIRQALITGLKGLGLHTLDEKSLERFIARHRIRYTGGFDRVILEALKKETGVEAVLITSLELYSDRPPPRIALMSRLVSTGRNIEVLWMKGIGLAGDDSPGILGLSLIEDPKELIEKAIGHLAVSLAGYMSGKGGRIDIKRKKFRPKAFYRSPVLDSGTRYRVVVVPFFNLSERKYAGEIMALHFVRELAASDNIQMIDPGIVRDTLLRSRFIMDDGISIDNAALILSRLGADLLLTGRVLDYEDSLSSTGASKVDFSVILIERKSRETVWTSKSYNKGDDGVFFFDRGKVNTAHSMASEMVRHTVEMILR